MPVRFPVPQSPAKNVLNIDYFRGVDLYNAAANVETSRSPEAPNMIRDEVGKVRKRMGYELMHTFPERINGAFLYKEKRLIHSGIKLYEYLEGHTDSDVPDYKLLYSDMNDTRSKGIPFGEKLYILDGKTYLVYDGEEVKPVAETAYVPTIIISRTPTGGGEAYEPLNLCSKRWTEQFLGTAEAYVYQLTTANLGPETVLCEVLQTDGSWKKLTEGTDFNVNRTTGSVTFVIRPGAAPITGVDNIKITPSKEREGYADKINKCDIAALYGIGGSPDRIFTAGNPDSPNMDFYSQMNDPTFFGDSWYALLGQDDSEIMGYSVLSGYLAAHKSPGADGRNVVIRSGELDGEGKPVFRIINTLVGEGVVSKYSFASLGKEPLFLTGLGVYAITAEEFTGEKYGQHRSFFLTPAITAHNDLSDAYAIVWRDFYMLCLGGKVYILDGLQKYYEKGAPYSSFQYECYYCTNIDARIMWRDGDELYFGNAAGNVYRFYKNVDSPESYNDTGKAIDAYWDTPDLSGKLFYKNKTFRYLAVKLAAAIVTGVIVHVQKKGAWTKLFDAGQKARYLSFEYINFAKFTFSTDTTPRTVGGKIKVKKIDKARFRLRNKELNEPFGLYSFALEYTENGRYKG